MRKATGGSRRRQAGPPSLHRGHRAGHAFDGFPGNLGGPDTSASKTGSGTRRTTPGDGAGALALRRSTRERRGGTARRATRAQREGHQEVGVSHCTDEGGEPTPGDPVEGRGDRFTEPREGTMTETSSSSIISTRLQRIAKLAKEAPAMAFTTLAHHIDTDVLREAHRLTCKDGAVGVDGQTAAEYAKNLRPTSSRCSTVRSPGSIAPRRYGGSTFRRVTGRRRARSGCRRSRTRSSNGRC